MGLFSTGSGAGLRALCGRPERSDQIFNIKGETAMKRTIAILLALMLLIAMMPTAAFAGSTKTVYISRNGSGTINLREGPGYDYDITGNYAHHNNKVSVLKTSGKWSKVKVSATGKTGWIRTYYIDGTTKSLGTGTHEMKKAAKLYAKATTSSSVRASLVVGDTVKVYGTERDLAHVTVVSTGKTGWVAMSAIGGTASTKPEKPSSSAKTVYRVKTPHGGNLNVHSTAVIRDSNVLRSIPNGTAFTILAKSGKLYKIKTLKGNIVGWVAKSLTAKNATGTVTASALHLRKGPSTKKTVLGVYARGTRVTVKSVTGNWAYVTVGGKTGYMSLTYLQF